MPLPASFLSFPRTHHEGLRRAIKPLASFVPVLLLLAVTFGGMVSPAHAQIFVGNFTEGVGKYATANGATINPLFIDLSSDSPDPYGLLVSGNTLYVADENNDRVGTYDATTGAAINANFITGLSAPRTLALSGNSLYVSNISGGNVGKYDAATGAAINASLVTGLNTPTAIFLSGNTLYVAEQNSNRVGTYDATTGAATNASFITGLNSPQGIERSGNNLYVSNYDGGNVGKYDATTGAVIDANFITGLGGPIALVLSGNGLYVARYDVGMVGIYDPTTGAAINASFITGLTYPEGLAIAAGPPTVTRGTGLIGDGVTLQISSNTVQNGGSGFTSGGKIHSPSGGPDLFFRAGSIPTFPGALDSYVEWALGDFGGGGAPLEWEGAVDGSDNWMKVIRDGDGAVSWAQFEFDFQSPFAPGDPILISIPLYVTRTDGADFTLAEAVAAVESDLLQAALDADGLSWTSSGNANWFGQVDTTHDGLDAAQSGDIANLEASTMQTTVTGGGVLSFWWKVSSEQGWDYLRFYIDDVEQPGVPAISGEVDWQQVNLSVPAGVHTLRWTYSKDDSVSLGADTAWLDEVSFIPSTYTVTTLADNFTTPVAGSLRAAINSANANPGAATILFNIPGGGTINLAATAGGARMLPILSNANGISIDGANGGQGAITIDGGSSGNTTGDRIFFVGVAAGTPASAGGNLASTASTSFSIANLTLQNGNARGGAGGTGRGGAGGGAGLGGAIFVNAGNLSVSGVTFSGNRAVGGVGGAADPFVVGKGGGGGMGGNGGAGTDNDSRSGGGGGGFGLGANGGTLAAAGGGGIFTGATGGGMGSDGGGAGGANGGGGGAGGIDGSSDSGGGGGIGGAAGQAGNTGGAGGFGGGGGSWGQSGSGTGGAGGYGGGGGGGGYDAGPGGFGGGGGGNSIEFTRNGIGGFGAGAGGHGGDSLSQGGGGGGGGLGAGGAIFVRQGATVTFTDGGLSGNSVTGGAGGAKAAMGPPGIETDGDPGSALGQGLFIAGSVTYQVSGSNTAIVSDTLELTGLTKTGAGTLVLSGANSYGGGTIVSAGRLLVNNSTGSATGAGSVNVNADGTLGGTGAVAGAVTVNNGGTLAPGSSVGTLTASTITFATGSTFAVEIGGTTPGTQHDQLSATGNIDIGSNVMLTTVPFGGFVPGIRQGFMIISRTGGSGTFAGLPQDATLPNFLGSGLSATISYVGGPGGHDVVIDTFSLTTDFDGDGMSDASEFRMAALGFDWQVSQPALVNIYKSNANGEGYYTTSQLQALKPASPLISRDPLTGKFTLTMDWKKSTDLTTFSDFPAPVGSSVNINPSGNIDFEFTSPDDAAFFRVETE